METQNAEGIPRKNTSWRQIRLPGERSAIRPFHSRSYWDVDRLAELDAATQDTMVTVSDVETDEQGLMTASELRGWMRDRKDGFLVAISGAADHPTPKERGDVQGFVYVTPDDPKRATTLLNDAAGDTALWELSWAKHPDALPHQVGSAIRQVVSLIGKETTQFSETKDAKGTVTAVEPVPAIRFSTYIEPDNMESKRVAEACGFVKQPDMIEYIPEEGVQSLGLHEAYLLDWQKFDAIIRTKTDAEWKRMMDPVPAKAIG